MQILAGALLAFVIAGDSASDPAEVTPASLHSAATPCQACHLDLAQPAQTRCTPCHERVTPHSRWKASPHQRGGLTCESCHSIHNDPAAPIRPALLKGTSQSELCFSCHPTIRHAQNQRSTHLFRDEHGRASVECSACHDVHGAAGGGDALLARPSLNDVCYRCHDDLRGPFLWEHPPARENCGNCHTAHGSNNTRLLTMRQPMLCQTCHAGDAHITAPGGPRTVWEMNRSCVNCHGRVHGSNHPSGITLQK